MKSKTKCSKSFIKHSSKNKIKKTQYKTTKQNDAMESELKQWRTQKFV